MAGDPTKAATLTATAKQAFTIMSFEGDLAEEESVERLNMVGYGPYGSGKTTLMASAADVEDMQDVLLIDIEKGKMSIKNNKRIKSKDKIDVIQISSFKDLGAVHDTFLKPHCRLRDDDSKEGIAKLIALEEKFRGVKPGTIKNPRRYNTVIIDSLTELDKMVTYELLGFSTSGDLTPLIKDNDMEVAEFKEYKQNNQMMQLIIRAFRDLDISFLAIAQEAYVQDELKRMLYSPAMTGKLGKQIQGMFDIVGYLQVGSIPEGGTEAPRRLMVQPATRFDAKSRLSHFKESFVADPTMQKVWDEVTR